jgi:hypothetical protein
MKRKVGFAIASVGLFLFAVSVYTMRAKGQTEAVANPAAQTRTEAVRAVNIIRVINTAEVGTCRTKGGHIDEHAKFLSWDELLDASCFKEAQRRFSQASELSFSPGPEIVAGLELRLVVSPDGRHYNLWLGQKQEDRCGFAFFSDERGLIYEGRAIGCSAQGAIGKP